MPDFVNAISPYILSAGSSQRGALILLTIACFGLLWGLRGRASRASGSASLWLCLAFGSLCSLTDGPARWMSCGLSVGSAFIHWKTRTGEVPELPVSRVTASLIFSLGLSLTAFFLLHQLVPNYRVPLVWEGTVIRSFMLELQDFDISNAFLKRLLWTEGLLSEGDHALLYGFPTVTILHAYSSLLSARIVSVALFLAATFLMAVFCKRHAHIAVGVAACVVFGLNELGLIFGRYGSSIAATLFSLVVALLCCANVVIRPTFPRIAVSGMALYVATLGYAPARLIVLVLIGMTLFGLYNNKRVSRLRLLTLSAVLCVCVVSVFLIQRHYGRSNFFLSARNEQFFRLFGSGLWPDDMLPKWRAFQQQQRVPDLSDYLDFGQELLMKTTVPQLRDLILPFGRAPSIWREFSADPLFLELYVPYLFPFLIMGALQSSSYLSRWTNQTLWIWSFSALVPIIFTNRVDSYRASMALIPFSIWIAVGVTETVRELRTTRLPGLITGLLVYGAIAGTAASLFGSLALTNVTPTTTDHTIESLEPRFINGSIIAVEAQEFRGAAQTQLLLLGRKQRGVPVPSEVLSAGKYNALMSRSQSDRELQDKTIEDMARTLEGGAVVIIAPRAEMDPAIQRLGALGFKAYPSPTLGDRFAIIIK